MESGVFPDSWKVAVVSPIHKAGSKDDPDNYRPISLLCILSKILEKLINKRLVAFLDKHNMLSHRQFGFRPGKSTEDAVQLLTELVSSQTDGGNRSLGIFLDLTKAFDTVSINILLNKLECFGVRGNALDWFRSYLTHRRQCVRIGEAISDQRELVFGVPQGSVLAPTLFTIYMNDILRMEIPNADILCYADDTVAIFHSTDWEDTLKSAELGMSRLNGWLEANLLTLNIKKTKFVAFHKTNFSNPNLRNIKIHTEYCYTQNSLPQARDNCYCNSIDRVESIGYLGVIVDQSLNFKAHISSLAKRMRKMIYVMKLLRPAARLGVRNLVYSSLCQSLLQYCIGVWGGAAKSYMIELERAQRSVLKVMHGKPRRYSTDLLYEEAKVLRVRQLLILRVVVKIHKYVSTEDTGRRKPRPLRLTLPRANSTFARRLPQFLHIATYNALSRSCDLKDCSIREAKRKTIKFLLSISYEETEKLVLV